MTRFLVVTWGKIITKTYKKNTLTLRGFETSVGWGAITIQRAKNGVKPQRKIVKI